MPSPKEESKLPVWDPKKNQYRWPDGSLMYTQGDGFICSKGHGSNHSVCDVCGEVIR